MAKNPHPGDQHRQGMVKKRSQVRTPLTGKETKRDTTTGKFTRPKADFWKIQRRPQRKEERLASVSVRPECEIGVERRVGRGYGGRL